MNSRDILRSWFLRFSGFFIPCVQSLPALGSWVGLMTLPFAMYLLMFCTNLPVSLVDVLSTFFSPLPVLLPERIFILFGLFLLIYSVIYLRIKKKIGIVTSGPYGLIRHPQYLGMILATLGLTSWSVWILTTTFGIGFLSPSLTICVWFIELLAYTFLATIEELFLSRNYGPVFSNYKRQVPFIFPFIKTNRQELDILISVLLLTIPLFVLITFPI